MTARALLFALLVSLVSLHVRAQEAGTEAPQNARAARVAADANTAGTYGDVILEGDACCTTAGVLLRAKGGRPYVVAQGATSDGTSGFAVFNSANAELLRVQADGVIALGAAPASPWSQLLLPVLEYTDTSLAFGDDTDMHLISNGYHDASWVWRYKTDDPAANYYLWKGAHYWRVAPTGTTGARLAWTHPMWISNSGNVGIGIDVAVPAARLDVKGADTALRIMTANANGYGVWVSDTLPSEGYGNGAVLAMTGNSMIRVSNLQIGYTGIPEIRSVGTSLRLNQFSDHDIVVGPENGTARLVVQSKGTSTFAGSVSVTGDVTVTGNITSVSGSITGAKVIGATYQDLAEWVPSETDLEPGTVVVLSRDRTNSVRAAASAYDTTVAGVVSAQPGVILGEAGPSKEMVATTGRVKVRVDATSHPIAIGDLLVTSSRPGVAMKSVPLDLSGVAIHRPGTLIGKALEPLEGGQGEILVLLSLQ